MHDYNSIAALEAVLFASGDAVALDKLCWVFEVTELQLSQWLDQLETDLAGRGIRLIRSDGAVQMAVDRNYNAYIERLTDDLRPSRLSAPTLETLAIIAYRQPVTRPEIEEIRGVKVEKALNTLLAYDMITEVGRRETTGRPILYGTTEEFLRHFGIRDLSELPELK
ncbi:MAG: SMC-Scp complex subunit ScpB [Eubacteriales bacterium]|nr:SMC-Scp complex subunit ScpB [Eubacteriales bacterium]MDD3074186.1 SMC-Scp complex subunit ScpB [Eubacteriales bacterium]MDD4079307.1 SMC-Scp complex subunit ScpB [Eubacteriales bacterium]MDD4768603.1 SMC-Scp complex subunit ScpB [Eubacteriales bacterium]